MGEDAVRGAGLIPDIRYRPGKPTSAADTAAAAAALAPRVDLLLFAGGDGTARDVLDAVGSSVSVLGVPTGVKMHSAVFGATPRAAGEAAALMAAGGVRMRDAEVMDLDEDAVREGRVSVRLYGHVRVPDIPVRVQQRKVGGTVTDPSSVAGIAAGLSERTGSDLLVLGPGTTMRAVAASLGADVALMGVNVLTGGGTVVAADAAAAELEALVGTAPMWIAVTPIGGQGFLFGRGNQQISPAVLRAAGRERLAVVATEAKLASLGGRPLLVDTGDEELDRDLRGHLPVLTGHGRFAMYPVR
jgi:predicted polyphosphate/ATP-dependent NAD kinase